MSASHSGISQALNEWNVRLEVFNLLFYFHGYLLAGRNLLEMFNALENRLKCIVYILFQLFRIYCSEGIIHPTVVPLLPVGGCQPHVLEWLKVFDQSAQFVILFGTSDTSYIRLQNFHFPITCHPTVLNTVQESISLKHASINL